MFFFESMMEVYLIICLLVLPLSCNVFFYFKNPKKVWFAPIVIIFLCTIVFGIFFPHHIKAMILSEYDDFTVGYAWIYLYVPIQIIAAFSFTAATRLIIWIKERNIQRLT